VKGNNAKAMPLLSHLNELRTRAFKSAFGIILASCVGWVLYERIIARLASPICDLGAATSAGESTCGILYISGVLGPIDLKFKISVLLGLIFASPIWLYQLWAFISPGLHKKERRNSIYFIIGAVPFFAVGIFAGYLVLPIAIEVLLSFTPTSLTNLVRFDDYLTFVTQLILVFGIAFELPVFLIALNLAHVLSGKSILRPWRYAIFGIVLFSAIATPTGDPFTLFFLAGPLILLYLAAGGISLLVDKARAKRKTSEG
jgi:sec-independent protein translocase protein TatC